MISSISNWFTNQKIAMIAAGISCIGFIGPALFDLAPPTYFASQPIVVERAGGTLDSSASSVMFLEPSAPVLKKMVEQPKSSEKLGKDLTSDFDSGSPKRQTGPLDIAKKGMISLSPMIRSAVIWRNYQSQLSR